MLKSQVLAGFIGLIQSCCILPYSYFVIVFVPISIQSLLNLSATMSTASVCLSSSFIGRQSVVANVCLLNSTVNHNVQTIRQENVSKMHLRNKEPKLFLYDDNHHHHFILFIQV